MFCLSHRDLERRVSVDPTHGMTGGLRRMLSLRPLRAKPTLWRVVDCSAELDVQPAASVRNASASSRPEGVVAGSTSHWTISPLSSV
jgi:hypothetical protein